MRLFARIFICAALIISTAVLFSGYFLIASSYENSIAREIRRALDQYQYDKFAMQASIISNSERWREGIIPNDAALGEIADNINGLVAFFAEDKSTLYSTFPADMEFAMLGSISEDELIYEFSELGGKTYLMIGSKLTQSDVSVYMLVATDISLIIVEKNQMIERFRFIYIITVGVSMVFVLLLSLFITHPIKKLKKAAGRMALGNLEERLSDSRKDEIGELAASFNAMADSIEEKMEELVLVARQKEDFVASFAHELKTPLTSVIGYADMLYQKKLPPEQAKSAAWYILNESLHLESLSLKLMDLIVLNRQDFVLEKMPADKLLEDVTNSLIPLLEERSISVHISADQAIIKVENDLFQTLLINLIDNAIKAECTDIWISGKIIGILYRISITDNGCGIPESELNRITEAFYMIDKSRARKQHGAGLGLALAAKIAEIHGSRLTFTSEPEKGTKALIDMACESGCAE